jgi:hypothetical protein
VFLVAAGLVTTGGTVYRPTTLPAGDRGLRQRMSTRGGYRSAAMASTTSWHRSASVKKKKKIGSWAAMVPL